MRISFLAFIFLASVRVLLADDSESLIRQARIAAQNRDHVEAVKLATKAIEADEANEISYYVRGRANFCAGKILSSMADFDRYGQLKPEARSSLWERGIACYYAQEFREGAYQFEKYQTYHSGDVENGVWHLLCLSRAVGRELALEKALPIKNDRRVPMTEIYKMFRGEMEPDQVLEVASQYQGKLKNSNISKARKKAQLFYAHLYVGLFHEMNGNAELTKKHIKQAVEHRIDHYMWDVAHVHLARIEKQAMEDKSEAKHNEPDVKSDEESDVKNEVPATNDSSQEELLSE